MKHETGFMKMAKALSVKNMFERIQNPVNETIINLKVDTERVVRGGGTTTIKNC